jgi:hypothetical protein
MTKKKNLTRTEYAEKFKEQMSRFNYIPQEGEVIIQCKESYPPYWFISNKGYLFTAYYNDIKIMTPNYDETGKANSEGKRAGRDWRYGTRIGGNKNLTRYNMARMMLDHFGKCEFETDEKIVAHHIDKRNNFQSNEAQRCNRADNLQLLPESVHKELTKYASKITDELDKEVEKKVKKSGCPQYYTNDLMSLIEPPLKESQELGIGAVFVMDESDPNNIKAKAYPITAIQFIED